MSLKTIRGRTNVIGPLIQQATPISLDPAINEGALVYSDEGIIRFSNGSSWNLIGTGEQGLQGSQGLQGIQGIQGTQGLQGSQGIQGIQGTQGLQGDYGPGINIIGYVPDVNVDPPNDPQTTLNNAFPGASSGDSVIDEANGDLWVYDGANWSNVGEIRGPQGIQGIQGIQGNNGTQGAGGEQGIQGIQGISIQGIQGIQGEQGEEGIQGSRGFIGEQGTQGIQGTQGSNGVQGNDGEQGIQGVAGETAEQGIQGIQGNFGFQGNQGIQGISNQGVQGIQGTLGPQGEQGIQGIQGIQGTQGIQGITGEGTLGPQGEQGIQGIQGTQGIQGIQGSTGPSTQINATDVTDDDTVYPVFVTAAGSNQTAEVSTGKLYFNPSTGTLNATNFNSLSDANYKKNITEIQDSMDILRHINTYSFKWKNNDRKSYGVIAQELEKIMPELVETNAEGAKTVSYIPLIAIIIDAIKKLGENDGRI